MTNPDMMQGMMRQQLTGLVPQVRGPSGGRLGVGGRRARCRRCAVPPCVFRSSLAPSAAGTESPVAPARYPNALCVPPFP